MKTPTKEKSRWRWVRRATAGAVLLLVILALIPFLFTTAVVRWALPLSGYERFSPQVASASLSAGGTLTVRDLVLHEPGGPSQEVLLKASSVRVTFSWLAVIGGTVREITADDVTLYARPANGEPVSFLELAAGRRPTPVAGPPMAAAGSGVASAKPFWFDKLECTGQIIVEPFEDFGIQAGTHAAALSMEMHGEALNPSRDLSLVIGPSAEKPELAAKMRFAPVAGGERITVDEFSAKGLAAGIGAAFAKRELAKWPAEFQQPIQASAEAISLSGSCDLVGAGSSFQAHVTVAGLEIASVGDAAGKLSLKGFNCSGTLGGPWGGEFFSKGTVNSGMVTLDSLAFGKNTLQHLSAPVTMKDGVLETAGLTAIFAGGDFAGTIQYATADNKLQRITLTVAHLDQKQVVQNLAPDQLEGEGKLSGTINLKAGKKTLLTGKIDLTSDGPGKLAIKDQDVAKRLAGELAVPAGTGILPANFSDIVVGQLKDYPYQSAHIKLVDHEGGPLLSLDYSRDGVREGEPGFRVKTTIAGKEVLANYTVQLPGVTVVLKGKTIEQLLGMAAGLSEQITGTAGGK